MINVKRFFPFIALAVIAGAWFNFSTKPRLVRGNEFAREIAAMEAGIAEWAWVESIEAPATSVTTRPTRLSVADLTAKVTACQVSLTRLASSGGDFEIRSNYPCMIHFLESVANQACRLRALKKNDDGTLLASLSMGR